MDGTDIRAYRSDVGLTQAQLGRQLGVAQSVISHWESGQSEPSRRLRIKLAAMMGRAKCKAPVLERAPAPTVESAPEPLSGRDLDKQRGTQLRMLRTRCGLSVHEFSEILGFVPTVVQKWETGEYTMSSLTVKDVECFFRVPLSSEREVRRWK